MADEDDKELYEAMRAVSLGPNGSANGGTFVDEEVQVDLEKMFLTPDRKFSERWLNKLQT